MGSPKKTLQYRYDARGNRRALVDQDGGRFTYSYDSVGRISQLLNPQGQPTTFSYDDGGRRTLKKLSNGTRTSFSYDAASNLTKLYHLKTDGTVLSSFDYAYDKVGNRTGVLEAGGSRVTWSYDNTYQLTGEHRTGTTPYRDTYTYDAAGNRLLKNHDGARTTYAYDNANQLRYSQELAGRTTFTFDADGNQQVQREPSGNRTTYSWDYENRMTLVRLPDATRATMAYEPEGLRVKVQEATGTKKFVWDEQNYLAETNATDDTQAVYTNEPRTYGRLISQRRSTTTHWYHFDAIGSTRHLTSSAAAVTDTRLFDAWGVQAASTGTTVFPFGYVGVDGYYTDVAGTRLYVRARYLAPLRGVWLSSDPIYTSTRELSRRYAFNSPVVRTDPSGMKCSHTHGRYFYDWDRAKRSKSYPVGTVPVARITGELTWPGSCTNTPGDYTVVIRMSAWATVITDIGDINGDGEVDYKYTAGCNAGTENFLRLLNSGNYYLKPHDDSLKDCHQSTFYFGPGAGGFKGCGEFMLIFKCPVPCQQSQCVGDEREQRWVYTNTATGEQQRIHRDDAWIAATWQVTPGPHDCCNVTECDARIKVVTKQRRPYPLPAFTT